ncbi:sodium-dependent transporter, partial [bacterium]|nr:sodium-dependent transporter [bacterium]
SLFNKSMILTALGQALFTLSIGMGALITYGSYLKDDTNILKSSYTLIFFDTLIALLAGIMIFPIVFSFGVEPTAGATLIFISLPEIFVKLPFGALFGVLFFVLLLFAAITSGISIIETPIAALIENCKISRKKATVIVSSIIAFISVFASLSFGILSNLKLFDKTIFDLLDYSTSNILLPFTTLMVCLICGWCIKEFYKKGFGDSLFGIIFNILLKFIVPIILILVLVSSI